MTVTIEKSEIITLMYRQERSDSDYGSCLWARFYLDTKNYNMSVESDCGNYSYGWPQTPDHESFLQLLCRMDEDYLLGKLANRTVVNGEATWEAMKEMLESEEIKLSDDLVDELKEACYHKRTADSVYNDVSSAFKFAGLDDFIGDYEIYSCIEMDYPSAAKKIVSVFQSAIVPMLKNILARGAKVLTNADRIRAMSDEELADFLGQYKFCDMCVEGCDACTYNGECNKRLLDWLQQPAEERREETEK